MCHKECTKTGQLQRGSKPTTIAISATRLCSTCAYMDVHVHACVASKRLTALRNGTAVGTALRSAYTRSRTTSPRSYTSRTPHSHHAYGPALACGHVSRNNREQPPMRTSPRQGARGGGRTHAQHDVWRRRRAAHVFHERTCVRKKHVAGGMIACERAAVCRSRCRCGGSCRLAGRCARPCAVAACGARADVQG